LFNVRKLALDSPTDWVAQFKHEKDPKSMLRIRMLSQSPHQMMLCDAHVSPVKYPQIVKFLIDRRQGENLSSRFVSVLEPFTEKPFIRGVRQLPLKSGDGVVIEVAHDNGRIDAIAYDPRETYKKTTDGAVETDGMVFVISWKPQGAVDRRFGVSRLRPGTGRTINGKINRVLPMQCAVEAQIDEPASLDPHEFIGRVAYFYNNYHRTAHTVTGIERQGDKWLITVADDLLVGLAKIDAVQQTTLNDFATLTTSTALPLAPVYHGTTATDELFRTQVPVDHVAGGKIVLNRPLPPDSKIKPGESVWLLDAGIGDMIEFPSISYEAHKP
jgi:hypothetical protein